MNTVAFEDAHLWYDTHAAAFVSGADAVDVTGDRGTFLRNLPDRRPLRVLDAGCGSGRDLVAFEAAGLTVAGLDPSAAMIASCRLRLAPATELRQEGLEDFADAAGSWDGIWAMASLLHLPLSSQSDVLCSLMRSLAPGGILLAWVKANPGGDAVEIVDYRGRPCSFYGPDEAMGFLAPVIAELRPHVEVTSVLRPDSRGMPTVWTQIFIRRSTEMK